LGGRGDDWGAPNQILTEPAVPMKALNPNASYQMAECQRIFTPLESHMRDGGGVLNVNKMTDFTGR
jgi:hypothetical protein